MKKFITLAALVAFASMAHAATLNWTINQVKVNGNLLTGGTAYLFITEQSGNFGATPTTVADVTSFIESGATLVTDDNGKATGLKKGNDTIDIAATKASTSGAVTGATGYYGNFGNGDWVKGFAVIFDDTYANAQNYIVTSVESANWTSAVGVQSLKFGSQANATWKAVPEPATATLALAGLALLLKRRRA